MKSFYRYMPRLKADMSLRWLTTSHHQYPNFINNLNNDPNYVDRNILAEKLMSTYFVPKNQEDISLTHAQLIRIFCEQFNVIAIWKEIMIPGTIDHVRVVKLYGYELDVKLCHVLISFYVNGLNQWSEIATIYFRNKKMAMRRKRKNVDNIPNTRTRVHDKIQRKVDKIINDSLGIKLHIVEREIIKRKVLSFVIENANLNIKKSDKGKLKIGSLRSAKNQIQLNRII